MKRTLVSLCLTGLAVLPTSGCGTLMFAERQDEPHSDRFDPNILILDGIGLLFLVTALRHPVRVEPRVQDDA